MSNTKKQKVGKVSAFDCLAVTAVEVFPLDGFECSKRTLKGYANVVLNDQLILRGLRINNGLNGLWVGYPVDPFNTSDDFRTIVVPMTRQLREHIENCVLEKYQEAVV